MIFPGNANLPIGGFRSANREIDVPGFNLIKCAPGEPLE